MEEPYTQSFRSFLVASATVLCVLSALWALRFRSIGFEKKKKKMPCGCYCSCGDVTGSDGVESNSTLPNGSVSGNEKMTILERQAGASIMEQLVPEITTHALSYLDYTSLCRLSMTNSAMRRAANDDNAWKALYHKDFTLEQDNLVPTNGWKSYYAATKAIISVNAEFYSIIRERLLPAMSRFWLHAGYVKCIHSSGELFLGYNSVMDSWAAAFDWGQGVDLQIQDVRVRVSGDMAWVTMKAFIDLDTHPFFVTNVYECHNGQWYMVHHHSCLLVGDADPGPGQPNGFA